MDNLKIFFHLTFWFRTEFLNMKFNISALDLSCGSKFFRLYLILDSLYKDLELLDETKVVWVVIDDKLQKTGDDLHCQMASI